MPGLGPHHPRESDAATSENMLLKLSGFQDCVPSDLCPWVWGFYNGDSIGNSRGPRMEYLECTVVVLGHQNRGTALNPLKGADSAIT